MKVSISLGGSLLTRNQTFGKYERYAEVLKALKSKGHSLIVVCGGGSPAREYIGLAKELGADSDIQDRLGILATHINALLLISALGSDAHPHIHRRGRDIKKHIDNLILVGGGHLPGSSTDYRTVLFAEAAGSDLIVNATDVDGVYDKDPKRHSDAVKLEKITFSRLEEIILNSAKQVPGEYGLFDLKAVRRAKKLRVPIIFIDGTDPQEIMRAVEGGHRGTVISD
jgi:uridylate kinase